MTTKELKPYGNAPFNHGYVLVHRAKKSQPWIEVARFKSDGQCCLALAEEHLEKEMGWPEDTLWTSSAYRLVSSETWRRMQVTQHLRLIGKNSR